VNVTNFVQKVNKKFPFADRIKVSADNFLNSLLSSTERCALP